MKTLTFTTGRVAQVSEIRGVSIFLLIAFGLAWSVWIPLWLLDVSPSSGVFNLGFTVGLFAPALATLATRLIMQEGFADAGLRPNLQRAWRYYLFAWLWPLLAYVALNVAAWFGLVLRKDVSGDVVPALLIALAMILVLFAEEFGWRGYLQVRLFRNRPLLAALATGTIWGVWHYPMVLTGYLPNQHGVAGLVMFPLYTILFSILLGWLRVRTSSVWAPCLAHASNNMVLEAIGAALFAATPGNGDLFLDPRGLVVLVPLGALCVWIIASGQLRMDAPPSSQVGIFSNQVKALGQMVHL